MTTARSGVASRYQRTLQPEVAESLRRWFRRLNRGMVLLWRMGLGPLFGRWPSTAGTILVIRHVGRVSGRTHATPLNYADVDGVAFCLAAFGTGADWYKNVMLRPRVEVWLPDGRWLMEAADGDGRPDRVSLVRRVLVHSGFAAPLFGLHPRRMTDAEIEKTTADYRLVELRRVEPLGRLPADLGWVWGIPVLVWLARWLVRRG